jgi:hypothetical protein
MGFLAEINSLPLGGARGPVAIKMFKYIMTIEPFLRKYPKFYDSALNKVLEFKTQRVSDALHEILLQTENFLISLRKEPVQEDPWCGCKHCVVPTAPEDTSLGTIYHVKNTDEYGEFLETLKEYVGGDCWAIKVNDEVLFDCYKDLSHKEQLQVSILRDKIVDCPHLLFTDMFTMKKDSTIMIDMYSNVSLVVKITYKAKDETLTLLATSNP